VTKGGLVSSPTVFWNMAEALG